MGRPPSRVRRYAGRALRQGKSARRIRIRSTERHVNVQRARMTDVVKIDPWNDAECGVLCDRQVCKEKLYLERDQLG